MTQPLSFAGLKNALSDERLQAYVLQGDTDGLDSVARYLWNLALTVSIQPSLHVLEITLRNHLYAHSQKVNNSKALKYRHVQCWLDAEPSLLETQEEASVESAKAELTRSSLPLTAGRLISKLGFGFWVSLCKRPYEQGRQSGPALWPAILANSFPGLQKANRSRAFIFHALDPIRVLRNRVSHHEPIWDHDLVSRHSDILDVVGWMNHGLAESLRKESPLPTEVAKGYVAYRPMAERLVRL